MATLSPLSPLRVLGAISIRGPFEESAPLSKSHHAHSIASSNKPSTSNMSRVAFTF